MSLSKLFNMSYIMLVGSRGHVTIPALLRKKLGWKAGMKLNMYEKEGQVVVVPAKKLKVRQKNSL